MNLVESIALVSARLNRLKIRHAFLGGSVIPLLVDEPSLHDFRPTIDVDAIVQIVTQAHYSKLEEQLRADGFVNDQSQGAPICRYIVDECLVDIMPIDRKVVGFASKWLPEAIRSAAPVSVRPDQSVHVISPACFLATKLEAFRSRGGNDYFGSRDLEDLITVIDGRANIVEEVRRGVPSLRSYIIREFRKLLRARVFREAVVGHVFDEYNREARAALVLDRIKEIVKAV